MTSIVNHLSSTPRVIVGMSGGVDSSIAALLLKEQGYRVEGLFMKNWEEDDGTEYCTAKKDLADAQAVTNQINIPLHTANFSAEYWDDVFEHFLSEYKAGRTPNPDILCNREIKFKAFLDYAMDLGADYIATGHYVRTEPVNSDSAETKLLKGLDPTKDQSYFLYAVNGKQLAKTLFPIGGLLKTEVRALAAKYNLATKNKKDSTGICFIGERRFRDFLKQYLPAQPGNIETIDGKIIGKHQGIIYHTIGQRKGLGIGGINNATESPWYVVEKDIRRNCLIVAQGANHPSLYSEALFVKSINWVTTQTPNIIHPFTAKIRYRQQDELCSIEPYRNGFLVIFDHPQRAIAPGQSVVFYRKDQCLGGGIIEERITTMNAPDQNNNSQCQR